MHLVSVTLGQCRKLEETQKSVTAGLISAHKVAAARLYVDVDI